MSLIDQYLKELEKELSGKKIDYQLKDTGEVVELKDEVALVAGLLNVSYGEVVEFANGVRGYVIDLSEDFVGVVILDQFIGVKAGDKVYATGKTISIGVSDKLLGRVIDPLGRPLDNLSPIKPDAFYPLEKIAPGVVYRRPVNTPLQTGIKLIDALIPIGRGQRELIIGDRGTGKTTIAIDTILNQKEEKIICIYCAVGQKNSKVASIIDLLKKNNALSYTVIINASSSSSAALQYFAPYAACAIGEYFMDQGKDALVIYDDLSKHAWAYRQISLILRRPAGREAYPGDIFYLHSRLLERACCKDEKYGGGSLTALPIVETLEGDVSSYIPTNLISITDGQIFLETDLFNAGIRPAVNIGLSVSRVGGNAQTPVMKKIAGKLKLDLAQYREMAAFSQFESELDEETRNFLKRGARLTQFLVQKQNQPYCLAYEVALIWAANSLLLQDLPLNKVSDFESHFLRLLEKEKELVEEINKSKQLSANNEKKLENLIKKTLKLIT
jgi:F-type H+-transporting ATPase subunit alpha